MSNSSCKFVINCFDVNFCIRIVSSMGRTKIVYYFIIKISIQVQVSYDKASKFETLVTSIYNDKVNVSVQ